MLFRPESVVVVGSSGAGKTSLVRGLRGPEYEGAVVAPLRYVTRPSRSDDQDPENRHLSIEKFSAGIATGYIAPFWCRVLGEQIENYGFFNDPDEARLRVYSANNAFVRSPNKSVKHVLDGALVVVLEAERDIREARIRERSPDMPLPELQHRLKDTVEDLQLPNPPYIINTSGLSVAEGQQVFGHLVGQILDGGIIVGRP